MSIVTIRGKSSFKFYKLIIHREAIPIHITIIEADRSYEVYILEEDLKDFALSFKKSISDYTDSLLKLLHASETLIEITNETLYIFKNKYVKYFMKKIEQVNHIETLQKCFNNLHNDYMHQTEEKQKLTEYNNQLHQEMNALKSKMEEIIENAEEHENVIYSCFMQVLNEKKQYIQYLNNFIGKEVTVPEDFMNNVPSSDINANSPGKDMMSLNEFSQEQRFNESPASSKHLLTDSDYENTSKTMSLPPRQSIEHVVARKATISNVPNLDSIRTHNDQLQHDESIPTLPDTPVAIVNTQDLFDKM